MRVQGFGTNQSGLSAVFAADTASSRRASNDLRSLIPSTKASLFTSELEKHLLDVRKGLGGLSKQTALTLSDFETQTSRSLSPKALINYSAYLGAFSYDQRARFVNGVKDAIQLNESIQNASDSAARAQEALNAALSKSVTPRILIPSLDLLA